LVKSDKEIAFFHTAARITEMVMRTARIARQTGVRKKRAAARITQARCLCVDDDQGDHPQILTLIPQSLEVTAA
jgi:Xaa-Pro aminopeptidase